LAFWSLAAAFWSAVEVWPAALGWAAFWSAVEVLGCAELLGWAAFWSVELGVVAVAEELGLVAEVLGAALWSAVVLLALLVAEVELEAGGFTGALALSLCPAAGLVVVAAGALLVLVEAEAAFWSVVEDAVPEAGGFTGALALSAWLGACVVLVVACGALALLVSVVGDCALPGAAGVVLLAEDALLLGAVVLVAAAFWSVLLPVEAWLLVQESEIIFTELTCNEPSLARVPETCTSCPSCGFRTELSPWRFTVWPLSAESTQLPPDCFRQPFTEFWSLLPVVLVALWLLWSVVDGVVVDGLVDGVCWLGCCWSVELGVLCEPLLPAPAPPACANAMPDANISAIINFLFMSFAPSKFAPRGFSSFVAGVRW
jgi:hypothetical protein